LLATLKDIAKRSVKGTHVTISSYAKGDRALARERADAISKYLKSHSDASVAIRIFSSTGNKVTVSMSK
jgi:hypothetical protein